MERNVLAVLALCVLCGCIARADQAPAVGATAEQMTVAVLERTKSPLLKADRPWESFCVNLASIVRDGDTWHLWYESYDQSYKSDNDAYLCYATSSDGIHWIKPKLGLIEYHNSKDNNILISGQEIGGMGGESVFLDPTAPSEEKFKLVYVKMLHVPPNMDFGANNPDWQIRGATSPDGIHWKMKAEPLLQRLADTQNIVIHDGERYRMWCRMWRTDGRGGGDRRRRVVGYTESPTFGDFPQPKEVFRADEQDPDDMDFYNTACAKLRDDLYLIFPSAFTHGDDLVSPQVAASRDGRQFVRVNDRKPLLPFTNGFDSKGIYVCPTAIPGDKPNTWWIYYLGANFKHGESIPRRVKNGGGIGRALIEVRGELMQEK